MFRRVSLAAVLLALASLASLHAEDETPAPPTTPIPADPAARKAARAAATLAILQKRLHQVYDPPLDPRTHGPDHNWVMHALEDPSAEGVNRRLGPTYADYHATEEKFPDVYLVPPKDRPGLSGKYQLGGPYTDAAGDFSSTQGQVVYAEPKQASIDRVTIIEWSNNCFTEAPSPPWHGGFRPEPAFKNWSGAINDLGSPVGVARGYGGWSNCGLVVFTSGFAATAGTATAWGTDPKLVFPHDKLPTAVSVTNRNEMALVTVIDRKTKKGQLAVVLLQSSGQGRFVHEWQQDYPGLPNVAVYTGMKIIGYVDLPEIKYPTSVCAVGNRNWTRVNGRNGNAGMLGEYNLDKQADRDTFFKGNNAGVTSTSGFAVVASKYENKACFIDLQPLFSGLREMYLTTQENFDKTRKLGPGPKEWPLTFEELPKWKPKVVATVTVTRPTAVICSLEGGNDNKSYACIATRDGAVEVYSAGGLGGDKPVNPEAIKRQGSLNVGKNPVALTYQKGRSNGFIAVSRGDRQVVWFDLEGKASVTRTLRDARLLDPVAVEQSDTHGVETNLITVVDHAGQQVLNYRLTTLVFATQGGAKFGVGPDGKAPFECGGALNFPGKPYLISATNVN
jgi:hypothetical protein